MIKNIFEIIKKQEEKERVIKFDQFLNNTGSWEDSFFDSSTRENCILIRSDYKYKYYLLFNDDTANIEGVELKRVKI